MSKQQQMLMKVKRSSIARVVVAMSALTQRRVAMTRLQSRCFQHAMTNWFQRTRPVCAQYSLERCCRLRCLARMSQDCRWHASLQRAPVAVAAAAATEIAALRAEAAWQLSQIAVLAAIAQVSVALASRDTASGSPAQ